MVYVVAEIGVNWDGDFEIAEEMIKNAKQVGCNAVKFQAFQNELVKDHPEYHRLIKAAISPDNIERIDSIAKSVGIEWFCTPMYLEAIDFLESYVKKFKIRFFDGKSLFENKESEIIKRAINTGKQVIISTQTSPKATKLYQNDNVSWLYCVPKYPCTFNELDFRDIRDFDGFSNHCPHFLAPLTAVILGANIVEVHVTLDKSRNFIDNNVSFDYKELENLLNLIRLSEKIHVQ